MDNFSRFDISSKQIAIIIIPIVLNSSCVLAGIFIPTIITNSIVIITVSNGIGSATSLSSSSSSSNSLASAANDINNNNNGHHLTSTTSIFDIVLSDQISNCSSFVNAKNQSITDPEIKYPPPNSDRLNYEYIITTPHFPKQYPNNIECISLIKAPNYNYQIMLEIREKFDLEPSRECLSDFVEIADGPFGFSDIIGRYCDPKLLPKEIRSTGPFLWLRFVSDATLPHSGFKIAYRFIRKSTQVTPKNYCYKRIIILPGESFVLNTTFLMTEMKRENRQLMLFKNQNDPNNENLPPLECIFDFFVGNTFSTYIFQQNFKQSKSIISCENDFIEIYHKTTIKKVTKHSLPDYYYICSENDFEQRHFTKSRRTTFRVQLSSLKTIHDLTYHITSIMHSTGPCPNNYFRCRTFELCISDKMLCNGQRNCPDNTDDECQDNKVIKPGDIVNSTVVEPKKTRAQKEAEDNQKALDEANKMHAIILGSISALLIVFVIVCLLITFQTKKKDRSKAQINSVDAANINRSPSNKKLYYEQLHSSEISLHALSSDKPNRKIYDDRHIWSKRNEISPVDGNSTAALKLNGGINNKALISDFSSSTQQISNSNIANFNSNKSQSSKQYQKLKKDKTKQPGLNKIGKYLSEHNRSKTDLFIKQQNPHKLDKSQIEGHMNFQSNKSANYRIVSPSNASSNSYNNQLNYSSQYWNYPASRNHQQHSGNNPHHQHIQRASSMGSGLRKINTAQPNNNNPTQISIGANNEQLKGNVEWYCGPVIKTHSSGSFIHDEYQSNELLHQTPCGPIMIPIQNDSALMKTLHVPGCRSLPNVTNVGLQQTPVYYTRPNTLITDDYRNQFHHNPYPELTTDYSDDDISSYRDETPSVSIHNPFQNRQINKHDKRPKKPTKINSKIPSINTSKSLHMFTSNIHDYKYSSNNSDDNSSNYGFKYFCAHEPSSIRDDDFVEYIA